MYRISKCPKKKKKITNLYQKDCYLLSWEEWEILELLEFVIGSMIFSSEF